MSETVSKSILVLANSFKKYPNRCVAGIEILDLTGHPTFGEWIRPIDERGDEGALRETTASINNILVKPLQLVEIEFTGPANDPTHPEDWIVNTSVPWKDLGKYEHSAIYPNIDDETGDLWGEESALDHRISEGSSDRTLRLIKEPVHAFARIYSEYNSFKGKNQFKKRLHVEVGGIEHELDITDPFFEKRHGINPQMVADGKPRQIALKTKGLMVVASLTPPLKGYQYKIAAAIIEP